MNELEEALRRAERELAETKAAIEAAQGGRLVKLAAQLAQTQAEAATLETKASALEETVGPQREEEDRLLEELGELRRSARAQR